MGRRELRGQFSAPMRAPGQTHKSLIETFISYEQCILSHKAIAGTRVKLLVGQP